jgi:hypothetical protein
MPKRSHSAPGPSAGYGYQIERALYWLARTPAGAAVGIETDDDVAIRNGTTSLLEQDKHSIADGAEPFGDRSKDLWNTLNIWLDAIEESRIEAETTRFLMVTNKELPEGLAKAISAATSAEAAGECITGLERAAEDPPEKIAMLVGRVLRSESRDTLIKIIQNTELVDARSGAAGPQVRTETIASLPLPSWAAPTAESILHELAGWVHANALAAWRENNPAWIARDHFINHLHAVLANRKRNIVRERAEYLIPVSADAIGGEKGRQFVKQLFLVTEDSVLVDSAIRDFIRCNIEKLRLSKEGNITDDDWRAFQAALCSRWEKIRARIIRIKQQHPLGDVGFEILMETTENYRERLAGSDTDEVYLTSGTYHLLADLLELGWHPEYATLIKEAEEEV